MTYKPTDKSFGNTYLSGNTLATHCETRIHSTFKNLVKDLHKGHMATQTMFSLTQPKARPPNVRRKLI
jgi:hypothetical protein